MSWGSAAESCVAWWVGLLVQHSRLLPDSLCVPRSADGCILAAAQSCAPGVQEAVAGPRRMPPSCITAGQTLEVAGKLLLPLRFRVQQQQSRGGDQTKPAALTLCAQPAGQLRELVAGGRSSGGCDDSGHGNWFCRAGRQQAGSGSREAAAEEISNRIPQEARSQHHGRSSCTTRLATEDTDAAQEPAPAGQGTPPGEAWCKLSCLAKLRALRWAGCPAAPHKKLLTCVRFQVRGWRDKRGLLQTAGIKAPNNIGANRQQRVQGRMRGWSKPSVTQTNQEAIQRAAARARLARPGGVCWSAAGAKTAAPHGLPQRSHWLAASSTGAGEGGKRPKCPPFA